VIEAAIKTIGGAHVGLSALIGTRLYAGQAPQGATLPYVVFEKDGYRPISGVHVDTAWGYSDFTFSAHASSLLGALQVIEQVRLAYNRYFGTVGGVDIDPVATCLNGAAGEDYDYELDHHLVDQGITFFHSGS
jgi:hypothetical protein